MSLDITRPEHRDALRWACELSPDERERAIRDAATDLRHTSAARDGDEEALRALSSPEQSAAIVRALLEGCGLKPYRCSTQVVKPHDHVVIGGGIDGAPFVIAPARIPALIRALLDATDRDSALAALREAGR